MKGTANPPAGALVNDPSALLFAYGSLKRGEVNYPVALQAGARFCGLGRTLEPFPLDQGLRWLRLIDCPGVGQRVNGELFRVQTEQGWRVLDDFEGHPHGYRRRRVRVVDGAQRLVWAWVYFFVR
jgi:gamma-glutamylcyclotransferase (GGCT)/AIG2-like uncharacterized protein YtfP